MKNLINPKDISINSIKAGIDDYLKSLANYEEIKDNMPDSTINIIKELIAGYAVYNAHKNQMFREETYLSSAKLESSVHNIAKVFGYYISRKTCPSLKIRYFGVPSISIKAGDILGEYGNYDVVYFGEDRTIEKLDDIDVYIGHYNTKDYLVELNDAGEFILELTATLLSAVDDKSLMMYKNGVKIDITKQMEDYVVFNKVVDYSIDPYSTKLFITDQNNRYGIDVLSNSDVITVKNMETDGMLNVIVKDVKLRSDFIYKLVNHYGTDGESVDKIRRLAPLFYSTIRRAVTEMDLTYVSEAHYLIRSAQVERDLGRPRLDRIEILNPVSQAFVVNIGFMSYTVITDDTATKESALKMIQDKISFNTDITTKLMIDITGVNEPHLLITSVDSRDKLVFSYSENIQAYVIDTNEVPSCCTAMIYYVMYSTTNEPISMTEQERLDFQAYLKDVKLVGLRIILVPARVEHYDFKVKVILKDSSYYNEVKAKISSILSKYELTLMTTFNYGEALVEISKIKVDNGGEVLNPVLSVIPNQVVFDIAESKYSYIKFNNVDIELIN